ncbi:hypothetical protein [Nonomuraea sp. B19D2]|uniref:hypothetical protein n=1 Tax=Nonomuraea sp. B19D2 TaxID=3159561 RepID=UPI0032DA2AFF
MAVDQLHHDPGQAVGDDVVDGHDVHVCPQLDGVAGFTCGALQALVLLRLRHAGQQLQFLDGHVDVQDLVVGAPDPPEPAGSQYGDQPVTSADHVTRLRRCHDHPPSCPE